MEQKHHGQTHGDVFLCIPPLYHRRHHALDGVARRGGRGVLLRGVSPKTILETISNERCTIVWLLVPGRRTSFAIEQGTVTLADYHLDQWRLMHIGAQPVPRAWCAAGSKVFPNQQYDTNYGLSRSCGPGCVHLGVENVDHVGAIGVQATSGSARCGGREGRREVTPGEVGEPSA